MLSQLPLGARLLRETDADLGWSFSEHFLSNLDYEFRSWIYGNSDKSKRGASPEKIQPKNNKQVQAEKDNARVFGNKMTVEELNKKLGLT